MVPGPMKAAVTRRPGPRLRSVAASLPTGVICYITWLCSAKKGLAVSRRTDEVIPRHCKRGKVRSCVCSRILCPVPALLHRSG